MFNEISNMTSIILPFYIKKINNLLLHDKEQSTYSEWQDELGLPDDEIEKLDSSRIVFNYECFPPFSAMVQVFAISGDAELSYEGDGVYSVIDILGNTLLLDISKQAY